MTWVSEIRMGRMSSRLAGILLIGVCLLAGCDETDVSSVNLRVHADFSAVLRVSSLKAGGTPTDVEGKSQGVNWDARARVECSTGQIKSMTDKVVEIADITITTRVSDQGGMIRVRLPRGEKAVWPRLIAPRETERDETRKAMSLKSDDVKNLGKSIKFSIELPADVVSSGAGVKSLKEIHSSARPPAPRIEAKADGRICTLVVQVSEMVSGTDVDPVFWDISW